MFCFVSFHFYSFFCLFFLLKIVMLLKFCSTKNFVFPNCRSNGPRVGQPEAQNLSRHRGRLRPSRPQDEEPPSKEPTPRRPTDHSRPSPRDDCRDKMTPDWRLPEKPALGSRPATPTPPTTSSSGIGRGSGNNEARSCPLPRAGMATARHSPEDLRAARHCCHASPDISTAGPNPAPTTTCLYGLEAAGPTSW